DSGRNEDRESDPAQPQAAPQKGLPIHAGDHGRNRGDPRIGQEIRQRQRTGRKALGRGAIHDRTIAPSRPEHKVLWPGAIFSTLRRPTAQDEDPSVKRGAIYAALLLALLAAGPAGAQNMISQGGWEGFALRDTDNKFDRCVLYNRSIQALSASPYQMLGMTRDAAGRIGLLIFYEPRMLTRGDTTVRLKLDQRP